MFFNSVSILLTVVSCNALVKILKVPLVSNFKGKQLRGITDEKSVMQSMCDILNADTTDIKAGNWILVKATPLPFSPPKEIDYTVNFCSAFCYQPEICKGVRVLIEDNDDHTMTFNTYSENQLLKNIARFKSSVTKIIVDPTPAIYQGHLILMETLTHVPGGKFDIVDHVPPIVTETQNTPFVKIGSSNDGKWMIFETCDDHKHTWVLLTHESIDNPDVYVKYKNEYDRALFLSGVDPMKMVDIPLSDYVTE